MRYLLLFFLLALQTSAFGSSILQKSNAEKVLTLEKSDLNACSVQHFMFQGQYYDAEIELAYNRFRYYDPNDGRYISVDPIGIDSGEDNFYVYVNDSNSFTDPLGLVKYHRQDGTFGKKRGRPKNPSTHGNSKTSKKPAVLYAMYDGEGKFQKYGITQEVDNPRKRYGNTIPEDFTLVEIDRGKRSDMLKKERTLVEADGGPRNKEPWSKGKKKKAGYKK